MTGSDDGHQPDGAEGDGSPAERPGGDPQRPPSQEGLPSAPRADEDGRVDPERRSPEPGENPSKVDSADNGEVGCGIWSRQTIRKRQEDADGKALFWNDPVTKAELDPTRLDPAGYRLTMGPEVYVSPGKAKEKASIRSLEDGEAFFIPPGQFAFLLTSELVKVPEDAFAFIALRAKTKFKGLVNVSGFHADSGFFGRLVFAVFNAGPGDVHLRRSEELFVVTFASLDQPTEKPRADPKPVLAISPDLITPIAGEIQSLAGLKESIDEVREDLADRIQVMERDVAILRWAVALVLSAFVALLVRFLTAK